MKKILAAALLIAAVISLFGCASFEVRSKGEPVVKVILKPSHMESSVFEFYTVDSNGNVEKTEPFVADADMTVYYADALKDFQCDLIDGDLVNTFVGTVDYDDPTVKEIMQVAADSIDHNIFHFSVWCSGGKYFAFVKLNVNWQEPCRLYAYDPEKKELNPLYTWQSMDLVGISTSFD